MSRHSGRPIRRSAGRISGRDGSTALTITERNALEEAKAASEGLKTALTGS